MLLNSRISLLAYALIGKSVKVREQRYKILFARRAIPMISGVKKILGSEKFRLPYRKPTLVGR